MDILNEISLFLQTSVQMGTHILFAIVGGIICEKVGNMNLGIEGMMLMGAAVGFQVACATANPFLAVLSAGLAGLVGALIYAFITVTLRGNQVVTGLVLTIFGTCLLRLVWIFTVVPLSKSYETLLAVYPISWVITGISVCTAYAIIRRKAFSLSVLQQQK